VAAGVGRPPLPHPGARRAEDLDLGLVPALLALVEPDERGDPASPLRWTTKSLRNLAAELTRQGHPVSAPTVGRLLRGQASAYRPMSRRWRASSTRTGTPSSVTSTSRPNGTRPMVSR
jgi:Rhodopirellula transposase DDE domain